MNDFFSRPTPVTTNHHLPTHRQSPPPVTNRGFDLVLFAYRNDLARERVLDYLAGMPISARGPSPIDRSTPTPQRLFNGLTESDARLLRDELERLGAHVGLVPLHAVAAERLPSRAKSRIVPTLFVVGFGLLGIIAFTATHRRPDPPSLAPRSLPAWAPPPQLQSIAEEFAGVQAEASRLNAEAVDLAQQGRYDAAIEHLRRARQLAPAQSTVRQNLQTVLLNSAMHQLEGGDPGAAERQLHEALSYGERLDLRQAMGVTRLRAGDLDGARTDLERAVDGGSKDPQVWLALGEVYLKQHDRPRALATLQRAREVGASGAPLDALLDRLGREVDAEWDYAVMESAHFRISFADGENRTAAQLVLDGLEDARSTVGAKFGYLPDHATEVVLYGAQDFHAITQTPVWAGAAYDGRIKVPVGGLTADDPALGRLLRHEYMHSLVADLSGNNCPVWLNEGLAVWAEEEQDGQRRAWAEEVVHGAPLFRLQDLVGPLTKLAPAQAQVAYAQSYLAVRELVDRSGARRLREFVGELRRQSPAAAYASVYAGDLADFEDRWLRSLHS
ncbi:MAG TPA: tetratricopeptide repeat protein [Candidatus Binatia bacterium]|nr:tetratricopeptide repeat protein [Candidatus Binatia bacterium]